MECVPAASSHQVARHASDRWSSSAKRHLPCVARPSSLGGSPRAPQPVDRVLQSHLKMAISDYRRLYRSRSPTGRDGKKGDRGRCLDRSRDGLTSKKHAVVDKQARRIKLKLAESLDADITTAPEMMADFSEGAMLHRHRLQHEDSTRHPRCRRLTLI